VGAQVESQTAAHARPQHVALDPDGRITGLDRRQERGRGAGPWARGLQTEAEREHPCRRLADYRRPKSSIDARRSGPAHGLRAPGGDGAPAEPGEPRGQRRSGTPAPRLGDLVPMVGAGQGRCRSRGTAGLRACRTAGPPSPPLVRHTTNVGVFPDALATDRRGVLRRGVRVSPAQDGLPRGTEVLTGSRLSDS
jgi:hypothetical protein